MTTSRLSARVGSIAPSATLAVDARAKKMKAEGRPVIGFGAGEPDFATPEHVVAAAVAASSDPANHRYTAGSGLPALREAIARKTARDSGLEVDPAQVVVTNGAKQAIYETFAALLDPGDEVMIPAPYWTTYPEAVRLAGGVPVPVLADETTGYKVSVEQLEAARTPRTKVFLHCSPSNPTGAVYDEDETQALGAWLVAHELWVVADEIYEHFTYTGSAAPSLPVLVPEVRERCVLINGVAKAYAMTGWRVGWLVAPADIVAGISNLQSHLTSNVSNVAQQAAIAALDGNLDFVTQMHAAFSVRRRLAVELLNAVPGFVCPQPDGAFYAYVSVEALIGTVIGGVEIDSSTTLAEVLLEQAEVAAVPGEAFGSPGSLRFSYALGDDDIRVGLTRVRELLEGSAS